MRVAAAANFSLINSENQALKAQITKIHDEATAANSIPQDAEQLKENEALKAQITKMGDQTTAAASVPQDASLENSWHLNVSGSCKLWQYYCEQLFINIAVRVKVELDAPEGGKNVRAEVLQFFDYMADKARIIGSESPSNYNTARLCTVEVRIEAVKMIESKFGMGRHVNPDICRALEEFQWPQTDRRWRVKALLFYLAIPTSFQILKHTNTTLSKSL
ncbi:hypothetical protein EJ06DRAFT_557398 [Trichodelitschia bisporula]|uniref:Uncharacterized protein n=1 Tax=Trichodelitschia bisporula TaxID=703511 RepID=A0A6G1HUR2_9PEZI|nr:hypothetical protein EJ06DRAFT_557398 [Trichodelitschia bisporula]